jgi:phospholipase/carboxylesterase
MSIDSYHHRLKPGTAGGTIVFAFHGTGGDENQFFDFAARLFPEATIVAPRGDVSEMGANRFFRRTGEGVYDMDDLARRTTTMNSFVRAHAQKAEAGLVLGLGYSNGANILASMMIEDGSLFDGAFLMHPLIPWSPKPSPSLQGREIVITAGERDPICPKPETIRLADYFKGEGASVKTVWHPGGHEIQQSEIEAARQFAEGFPAKTGRSAG